MTRDERRFETATDVRKFEIGLFWQRSLFFWGFIGASFVAYAELVQEQNGDARLPLAVACFGFVCSVAWSLVNRGSKYWQEYWENEVELIEYAVLGYRLFGKDGEVERKNCWLQARKYSVSKLAIALSDFTVLVWAVLIGKLIPSLAQVWPNLNLIYVLPAVAILYAIVMAVACRTSPRRAGNAVGT